MKFGTMWSLIAACGLLFGCNSRLDTSSHPLPAAESSGPSGASDRPSASGASGGSSASGGGLRRESSQLEMADGRGNMAQEVAVSEGCLKAWRMAIAGDEDGAMKVLSKLDEENPGISTVQMMMGQVEDHFHKYKEAVEHYKKGYAINQFSSMQTFKLAESLRRAGKSKESIVYYKKLLERLELATREYKRTEMSPLVISVRLGLANAYKESKDTENARAEVKKVLEQSPENKDAQSLLKDLERSG